MKNQDPLAAYNKYHSDRDNERIGLFTALNEKYSIESALYPGSFTHITPSFVFPHLVYVDSYKAAGKFFDQTEVLEYITTRKKYEKEPTVTFHLSDYYKDFGEQKDSFDLLISQYAGFISQACKKYLKKGGILVANNSHGDASMAFLDPDYEFVAVYNRKSDDKYAISEKNLNSYFIHKKQVKITKAYLEKIQRGIGYTQSPSGYIFKKVKS
ncbi:MAG: hypothetical protein P1V18_05330 [Candidatus Gracilibacteria bacterium]|nr:hypothetical protein [Candidatus Gracilibacteria bacterium]